MSLRYLLDTNVLIALRDATRNHHPKSAERQRRIDAIAQRCKQIPAKELAMSFVSFGELAVWAEKSADPTKAHQTLQQLKSLVQIMGAAAAPANSEAEHLALRYAQVRAVLERAGSKIGTNDTWIAAHALALGLTVVTNDREYSRVPQLQCEDWTV